MKDNIKLLLLDNYDSFTYNLYDYLSQLGVSCIVYRNDQISISEIEEHDFDGIVLSPGPKRPETAGILMEVVEYFYQSKPILGICLGMQAIGEFFGAKLVHANLPVHGKTSWVNHSKKGLFDGIKCPTQVMRYHSLVLEEMPTCLESVAWTEEGELMALHHKSLPVWGVQFHPESILTTDGLIILDNWIKTCVSAQIVLK